MEILDKPNGQPSRPTDWSRHIYLGVALIVVGAIWMLYNFDLVGYRFFDAFFSWEMLLVVIGGYLLSLRRWVWGGLVTAIGVVFLLTNLFGIRIPFDKVIWPSIFILAGAAVLLTRTCKR